MKKITSDDIECNIYGFRCEKIKKLSNKKHTELEEELRRAGLHVMWTNTEEMNYLNVCWIHIHTVTDKEMIKICDILNNIINR